MSTPIKLDSAEFNIMRDYIEKSCAILVLPEKAYLIEARLMVLMAENGCATFREFHALATADKSNRLRDKIIDAMTTNETSWFRDRAPFTVLEEVILKEKAAEVAAGHRPKINIWSAACSTGQEPYSIAMLLMEQVKKHGPVNPAHVSITATDISTTVLFLAQAGRYDNLAISRGLPEDLRNRYFTPSGSVWAINDQIKKMITFKKLNLQDDFSSMGRQDLILCRNVLIYFSEEFKRSLFSRIARLLRPGGYLLVGASESVINYTDEFEMLRHGQILYYRVKP